MKRKDLKSLISSARQLPANQSLFPTCKGGPTTRYGYGFRSCHETKQINAEKRRSKEPCSASLAMPRTQNDGSLPFLRPSISKFDDSAKVSHGLLLVLLNLAAAPHFLLFFSKCPVYSGVGTRVSPAFGSSSENAQWNFVKTQRTARTENANLSSDALPAQGVN